MLILAGACRTADYAGKEPVGRAGPQRFITPVHQILTPAGVQVELPGMRLQAVALSPDGRLLITSGKTQDLVLVDPQTGEVKQRVKLPSSETRGPNDVSSHILKPDESGQLSFTGLVFSPDGSRIYLANVNGDIKVFGVEPDGRIRAVSSIGLPAANAPWRKEEIPSAWRFPATESDCTGSEPVQSPGGDRRQHRSDAPVWPWALRRTTCFWSAQGYVSNWGAGSGREQPHRPAVAAPAFESIPCATSPARARSR